jgi:hypothetical protein
MARTNWLSVDMDGLRKLLERKGKEFAIFELVQNAWDEDITQVEVSFPAPQRGSTTLSVVDDSPQGFRDLGDSYTLYAESYKKRDPQKRGAFNAGEKFVLALCSHAQITSTTGRVLFDDKGRHQSRVRREVGTEFSGVVRITHDEWAQVCEQVKFLIPPVKTIFNGVDIPSRKLLHKFTTPLQSVISDEEGTLRKTVRRAEVRVYDCLPGQTARLYEMGIPVVETEDKWDVDIQQKVPLNMERDNVTPAFLKAVRTAVLNEMSQALTSEDSTATWVREAVGSKDATPEAVSKVMDLRFGQKRVTYDASDYEANNIAVSRGYTLVMAGSLSGEEWKNVKRFAASLPAGQVTPSPKPYSPDGEPLTLIPANKYNQGMRVFVYFAKEVGHALLGRSISVSLVNDMTWGVAATFGPSAHLTVNVGTLGYSWFGKPETSVEFYPLMQQWLYLLLHEFAHYKVQHHLTDAFQDEIAELGGKLVRITMEQPNRFNPFHGTVMTSIANQYS